MLSAIIAVIIIFVLPIFGIGISLGALSTCFIAGSAAGIVITNCGNSSSIELLKKAEQTEQKNYLAEQQSYPVLTRGAEAVGSTGNANSSIIYSHPIKSVSSYMQQQPLSEVKFDPSDSAESGSDLTR